MTEMDLMPEIAALERSIFGLLSATSAQQPELERSCLLGITRSSALLVGDPSACLDAQRSRAAGILVTLRDMLVAFKTAQASCEDVIARQPEIINGVDSRHPVRAGTPPSTSPMSGADSNDHSPLRTWFLDHLDDPYPTAHERRNLHQACVISGTPTTPAKVLTWFQNARKRSGWVTLFKTHAGSSKPALTALLDKAEDSASRWDVDPAALKLLDGIRTYIEGPTQTVAEPIMSIVRRTASGSSTSSSSSAASDLGTGSPSSSPPSSRSSSGSWSVADVSGSPSPPPPDAFAPNGDVIVSSSPILAPAYTPPLIVPPLALDQPVFVPADAFSYPASFFPRLQMIGAPIDVSRFEEVDDAAMDVC